MFVLIYRTALLIVPIRGTSGVKSERDKNKLFFVCFTCVPDGL